MKKLVVLLGVASLLVAGGAAAQIDPDLDMFGFYFDEGATIFCTDATIGTQVPVYLCITNPSDVGAPPTNYTVSGWECSFETTLPANVFILSQTMRGDQPTNFSSTPNDYIVGLGTPFTWAPVVVVLDVLVGLFGPGEVNFTLHPAENSSFDPPAPGYASGDDANILIPCGYSAGGEVVCAVINGDCNVTASEDQTWGAVKTLYK